jgi:S-adenosylmethionine/arginine decarboxylase-like enzyme
MKTVDGKNCWGMLISVDLEGCDPEIIRNADKLKVFLKQIVKEIDMKAFGDPIVVHFGNNQDVFGYSIAQLIETSLISGHFAEKTNSAYLDIFSCKEFVPEAAAKFCKEFFKAKTSKYTTLYRG